MTMRESHSWSGVPLFTRDLAGALADRGHNVAIFTLARCRLTGPLRARDISLVTDLRKLAFRPDIIHGQAQPALLKALLHFRDIPAIQVIHDATSEFDAPLDLGAIRTYAAVDNRCLARVLRDRFTEARAITILGGVDLQRFRPRPPLPVRPRRALIFSNYAGPQTHLAAVLEACRRMGLAVDVIGAGVNNSVADPETRLGEYDLVFAKARCAIEALATGAAVILCDASGLGSMVTADNVTQLRQMNFGGGLLVNPVGIESVMAEIGKYDAADAALAAQEIRRVAGLDDAAEQWLSVYGGAIGQQPLDTAPQQDRVAAELAAWRAYFLALPLVSLMACARNLPVLGSVIHLALRSLGLARRGGTDAPWARKGPAPT